MLIGLYRFHPRTSQVPPDQLVSQSIDPPLMESNSFDDLKDLEQRMLEEFEEELTSNVDEYGEIIDDADNAEDFEGNNFEGSADTTDTLVDQVAVSGTSKATSNTSDNSDKSWSKRSYLARNETDKEFEMFKLWCLKGSGSRSLKYISTITNITPNAIHKISQKNNWQRRSQDYDRAMLVLKAKEAEGSRHELHLRKLEQYREEQEALGQQLTLNAARIAFLANNTLAKMLSEDKELDARDLPSMLSTAAKLADIGKNLQSTALGVDNLLAAVEEGSTD